MFEELSAKPSIFIIRGNITLLRGKGAENTHSFPISCEKLANRIQGRLSSPNSLGDLSCV
jgi:hypothetical protein